MGNKVIFQVAAIRKREAEEKAREEAQRIADERFKRRSSRFQVVPAPENVLRRQSSENHLDQVTLLKIILLGLIGCASML